MRTALVAALVVLSLVGPASGNKATQIVGVPAAGTQAWKIFNSKMSLTVLPVGAVIHSMEVPDRKGNLRDIVLGFDSTKSYMAPGPYFGAIVGRVANRLKRGKFTIDGVEHKVICNDGLNSLHGGAQGFDKKVWDAAPVCGGVEMKLRSLAGDQGYPGTVETKVSYILKGSSLHVTMTATCASATPINLAQHSYFNLGGHDSGSILGHEIKIDADGYMPTDADSIPTGMIDDIMGTEFDFCKTAIIGKKMNELAESRGLRLPFDAVTKQPVAPLILGAPGGPQSDSPLGYDNNFVLKRGNRFSNWFRKVFRGGMRPVATVTDKASGTRMTVTSNAPGVQFYTGNFLDGITGKGGAVYQQHSGLCLETQTFPNSINADPKSKIGQGATRILRPGETYTHKIVYTFSTC